MRRFEQAPTQFTEEELVNLTLAIIMPSAQTRVRPNPCSRLAVFVVNTDEKNLTAPDKK